jgi:uncharacterized protein YdeI (YjbR/CyaY-like superfamily)
VNLHTAWANNRPKLNLKRARTLLLIQLFEAEQVCLSLLVPYPLHAHHMPISEQPIMAFATAAEFRRWLTRHHANHPGLWILIAKKASGIASVTYAEALDEALCLGWIDGQKKSCDETTFLQKFTPRGKRSIWSKINCGHIVRLEKEGRMKPAGLAAVAAAKSDGRWDAAYHGPRNAVMPEDFLAALAKEPKAEAFFETLNKTQRYAFFFRITTAKKPETRSRRIADFVAMLKRGEKIH